MVRAKVMQRSATTNRRQPRSANLCSKSKKRERTTATEQTELGSNTKRLQQDHGQTFELPQLAQLLSDIDHEQDDDCDPFLPLDPHTVLHHAPTFANTSDFQNHEDADANPTAAYLPVVSLAEVAVQPAQPFHSGGISQQGASSAALQQLGDAQQHSLQQSMSRPNAPSHPASQTVDGQQFLPQPSGAHITYAAEPQGLPQDLLPPEEPLSPHTLQSMFDMPALSFDSSQHILEDDACASTPQSQQQQATEYQSHGYHQQQQLHDNFESGPVDDLQPHHSYPWASSSMGDLQWTDSCPVPRNLPNVIRKISSDSTIDPSTGKLLVYGKAMAHRHVDVELPTVAALFTDMNATVSQKSWQFSSRPHARRGSLAAKAATRQRASSSSVAQGLVTAPPQDHALQGSVDMLQQYHQPAAAPQPYHGDQQAPFSDMQTYPHNTAAPSAPHTDFSASAMQYTAADGAYGQGHFTSSVHGQPLLSHSPEGGLYPPQPGFSTPAGFTGVMQHPLPVQATQTPVQQPTAELYTAGLTNIGEVETSSADGPVYMPAGSGDLEAGRAPASAPAKMGFGGILSGVVKEAAETATKRPPVFRYEDFKTANQGDSFRGVSRDRWSVQWNASIPKADKDEGEHFLGRFSQQTTAVRACDVASLKVHGTAATTHFPAREYEDGMEELAPVSVLDVVMALQRQGAIGQFKNSRYRGVWQLDKSCWEARLEEAPTQESSTSDRPSANGDQSQSQLTPAKSVGSNPA